MTVGAQVIEPADLAQNQKNRAFRLEADMTTSNETDKILNSIKSLIEKWEVNENPPPDLTDNERFVEIYQAIYEIRRALIAMERGELTSPISYKGCFPGVTKSLQASLQHFMWQIKAISSGDFSQRVDFLGEFSQVFNNMTKQLEATIKNLIESEESQRLLVSEMRQGLAVHEIILDKEGKAIDYRFIFVNEAFERLTGLKAEEITGKTVLEVLPNTESYWIENYGKVALTGKPLQYENYSKELGKYFEVTAYSPKQGQFAVIMADITTRRKADDEIIYLSYHDQLTDLYNRRFFEIELKRLDTSRNFPLTIIMGDVNGLKHINDNFGHSIGDELLIKVANAIKKGCRDDDIASRLGGDEFVIILPKTKETEAEKIIKRIKDLLLNEKAGNLPISISFGYETKRDIKQEMNDILKRAEENMYKVKSAEIIR